MSATGRPRTDPGSWGTITTTGLVQVDGKWIACPAGTKPTRWRARTRVRDLDGKARSVQKDAPTKGAAERDLTKALRSRVTPTEGSTLRDTLTVGAAGALWLARVRRPDSRLSASTVSQYGQNFARYVERAPIASRTLREANTVPVVRTFLEGVADDHGSGAAKTARSVLSGILTMAVDDGVLPLNAARQVRPPKASTPKVTERDTARAFTRAERADVLAAASTDSRALAADVVDLVRFLAGTGARIGEALAVSWDDVVLSDDDTTSTVHLRGTKTVASDRTLTLPAWLSEAVTARHALGVDLSSLVFSGPRSGELRDTRNTTRYIRELFRRHGYGWATPHSFRRTVATLIDTELGSIGLAANVLGHADASMTARFYISRRSDTSAAAAVL